MIETENQRQVALSWIAYWKQSIASGEQSWMAGEGALSDIMTLRHQIDAYDRRMSVPLPVADPGA